MLETVRIAGSTPVMGINSNPARSRGFLCLAGPRDFAKFLEKIMIRKIKPVSVGRLRVKVSGKKLRYEAVNDILISHENPASSTRYTISYKGRKENQLSSGIWVATPLGSTAAYAAAGGKPLKIGSRKFAFIVRELEDGKNIRKGLLESTSALELVSGIGSLALYFDGHRNRWRLRWGDRVTIDQKGVPAKIFFSGRSR